MQIFWLAAGIAATVLVAGIAWGALALIHFERDEEARWQREHPAPLPATWPRQLPRSATPWDLAPLVRAQIAVRALLVATDRARVPCLDPGWLQATKTLCGAA